MDALSRIGQIDHGGVPEGACALRPEIVKGS